MKKHTFSEDAPYSRRVYVYWDNIKKILNLPNFYAEKFARSDNIIILFLYYVLPVLSGSPLFVVWKWTGVYTWK